MIYLDYAAATPVNPKVLKAMEPYFTDNFFNPSSPYLPAKKIAKDYEDKKATIAHAIGAKTNNLIITASATEANNLAFTCVGQNDQILYLETEHDSIRTPAKALGGKPIKVLKSGLIDLVDLKAKITDRTTLISVSLAGNELGTIQPLSEISAIIKEVKLDRMKRKVKTPLYLHSDASQALNLLDISVARLGVDLLTINSAKVYGPKGIGALYASHEIKLKPLILGGGQEQGLRSGTENIPGVIGFAKAVELAKKHLKKNRQKYQELKSLFLKTLEDYKLISQKHSLDNFIVVCFSSIDAERLIFLLEEQEIYVATGAACAAMKGQKSHVLSAIGLTDSEIASSLRITLGEGNTKEDVIKAAKIINHTVRSEKRRITNEN